MHESSNPTRTTSLLLASLSLAAQLALAGGAHAQGFAPNSCWGRCGGSTVNALGGPSCGCHDTCQIKGDCCPDKRIYCPVQAARVLCPVTQPNAGIGFFGTDLGWSFEHKNKLEILFGDTQSGAQCQGPTPNDDSQATLPLAKPAWLPTDMTAAVSCQSLPTFQTSNVGGKVSFTPITLVHPTRGALPLGPLSTPGTGFSDGTHAYVLFGRGEQQACSLTAPTCPTGFLCDFVYGVCADASSPQPGGSNGGRWVYIAQRPDEAKPTEYRVAADYLTNKFSNPTAQTVRTFNPATSTYDYTPGTGASVPSAVLLFGRPGPGALPGGEAPMYLLYNALPAAGGTLTWAPQYFAGLVNGVPTWSPNQINAVPVADTRTPAGLIPNEFAIVNQADVVWNATLGRWLMLYGGDLADWIYSPPTDQPRRGAIHMRMSKTPWGPWSDPLPLLWREHMSGFMACDAPAPAGIDLDNNNNGLSDAYENPGLWLLSANGVPLGPFANVCVAGDRNRPVQGVCKAAPAGASLERGNMYAPNVIDSWTTPVFSGYYDRSVVIYFNVSTWNPYEVVLASARIDLPYEIAPYGKTVLHLRDYRNRVLRAAASLDVKGQNPGDLTTGFAFSNATARNSDVRIGDSTFIIARDGRYLTRTTTNGLGYMTLTNPMPAKSIFKIVGTAPNGTSITMDGVKFGLQSDNLLYVQPWTSDVVEVHSGLGSTAYWTLNWQCDPNKGDTC
jgi:hypothetical protein